MRIGVLALQGGFREHITQINEIGHEGIEIKDKNDLINLDGIILPGGESTAIRNILDEIGIMNPLINIISSGIPTLGTCAGMILLAKEINGENSHLNLMNIGVKRNAFGRQLSSFREYSKVEHIDGEIELVFIRAPYIDKIWGEVEILAKVNDKIVAVKENNIIATSFHPELTNDLRFIKYFINLCENRKYN